MLSWTIFLQAPRAASLGNVSRSSFRGIRRLATGIADQAAQATSSEQARQQAVSQYSAGKDGQYQQWAKRVFHQAVAADSPRHDWTREEISVIYNQPLMELAYQAVSPSIYHAATTLVKRKWLMLRTNLRPTCIVGSTILLRSSYAL